MPKILGIILFFLVLVGPGYSFEYKTGDIIMEPLNCWVCNLIEAQTQSIYSHMGLVVLVDGEVFVLEAFGSVQLLTLEQFLSKKEQGQDILVLRHKYLSETDLENINKIYPSFIGAPYNSSFRWDTYINGERSYYCSEIVYEILVKLTSKLPPLIPMPYDIYPEHWDNYFQGDTPRWELGVSPADFIDERFFEVIAP